MPDPIAVPRARRGSQHTAVRILALSGSLLFALFGCAGPPATPEPGVLLVILDTVRADHLSAYGYARETSPNLDRLAAEGERYERAYAQSPWTLPAIATILTGQPPHVHQASRASKGLHKVAGGVPTLAELFSAAGFRTAAVMNVVFCSPESGLSRGFDRYDYARSDRSNVGSRDALATTDAALSWLEGIGDDPYFLVVHYFDAHLTYDPPPPYDTMFEPDGRAAIEPGFGSADQVREIADGTLPLTERQKQSLEARYDGEIRFIDDQFGRLRRGLEERGLWDRTTVLVVADHGEEFWEHGSFEHGHTHHRELIEIPLILRRPGTPGGVVRKERVRQLDIAPTLLHQAGLRVPAGMPGPPLGGGGAELSVAEGSLWAGDLRSSRTDRGTVIWNRDTEEWQFFAANDPRELDNLWPSGPPSEEDADVRRLRALPSSHREEPGEWEPTAEQMEALRSLGYAR